MIFDRENIIRELTDEKIIVIVRGYTGETLVLLAEAMWQGGIRFLEVTYDHGGSITQEQTAADIRRLVEHFQGRMHIGAGTVLSCEEVEATFRAGGEYIISPNVNVDVIRKTRELGMLSMPGAMTPSEVETAYEAGADFVKLFPVVSLGASYVKAIKAPLCHVRMLAVGGIDENNMAEYLSAGVSGFGIGSNIVNKKLIAAGDFAAITELARAFLASLKSAEEVAK